MEEKICQSCGMPLSQENLYGSNQDGTRNEDYCCYCYKDGAFTDSKSMSEMIEFCADVMAKQGIDRTEAVSWMNVQFPTLKRWK